MGRRSPGCLLWTLVAPMAPEVVSPDVRGNLLRRHDPRRLVVGLRHRSIRGPRAPGALRRHHRAVDALTLSVAVAAAGRGAPRPSLRGVWARGQARDGRQGLHAVCTWPTNRVITPHPGIPCQPSGHTALSPGETAGSESGLRGTPARRTIQEQPRYLWCVFVSPPSRASARAGGRVAKPTPLPSARRPPRRSKDGGPSRAGLAARAESQGRSCAVRRALT
jgi:hypothetical protein